MANTLLLDSIHTLNGTVEQIISVVEDLPEAVVRTQPGEEEWSILQILGHLAEAIPYWLSEIERLVAIPGTEWGRGLQDEARLQAVSNLENASIKEILQELAAVKARVETIIGGLTDQQLLREAPSRNPRFGTKPISFIIDHLLVEHVQKHQGQIQRNLQKLNS